MELAYNSFWLNHLDVVLVISLCVLILGVILFISAIVVWDTPIYVLRTKNKNKQAKVGFIISILLIVGSTFTFIWSVHNYNRAITYAQNQAVYQAKNVQITKYAYPDGYEDDGVTPITVSVLTKNNKTIKVNETGYDTIKVRKSLTVKKTHLTLKKYTLKNRNYLKKHGLCSYTADQYYTLTINKPEKAYSN